MDDDAEETSRDVEGFVALLLSILFFGSYGIAIKSEKIVRLHVDPMVFQCYYSPVVAALSFLTLSFVEFRFSYWGIVGGAMWVASSIVAFLAIHEIGYALALAIWAGTTVLVGFVIGTVAFEEELANVGAVIAGVAVLVTGIVMISLVPDYLMRRQRERGGAAGDFDEEAHDETKWRSGVHATERPDIQQRRSNGQVQDNNTAEQTKLLDTVSSNSDSDFDAHKSSKMSLKGIFLAVLMGLINGSLMVPLHFYSDQQELESDDPESVGYLVSFGIGALAVTPPSVALWFLVKREWPKFHFWSVVGPGSLTGLLWTCGYVAATYSTIFLGQAIGYPLTQAAILVAGLWGVFYFKEIRGSLPIITFFLSGGVILAGVVVMSIFS